MGWRKAILISIIGLLMWQFSYSQSNIGIGYSFAPTFSTASNSGSSYVFTHRSSLLLSIFKNKRNFFSTGVGYAWYGHKQNLNFMDSSGTTIAIEVTSKYRYTQIPILYSFKTNWEKISFTFTTGLLIDLLLKKVENYHGFLPQQTFSNKELKSNNNGTLINMYVNPAINLNITDKTFLIIGPDVIYSLNHYRKGLNSHFFSLGLQLRIVYTLF